MAKIKDYLIRKNEKFNSDIEFRERERDFLKSRENHEKDTRDTKENRKAE